METPVLKTPRLILRPLRFNDASEVFHNWTSDTEVSKFMNWNTQQNMNDTIEWVTYEVSRIDDETNFNWGMIVMETGELIGTCGFALNKEIDCFELGYNVMKKYWCKGLTSEAAKRIMAFARDDLHIKKMYCRHAIDNPASGAVMMKAGFIYQKDGTYTSFDGQRTYASKEYMWTAGFEE